MPIEFGRLLRRLREEHEMSLLQLATAIEISVPYLSEIERGRRSPLTEERIRLASRVLGLSDQEREDLLRTAAEGRGYFELAATNLSPGQQAFGAALARRWNDLEEEQIAELTRVLARRGR